MGTPEINKTIAREIAAASAHVVSRAILSHRKILMMLADSLPPGELHAYRRGEFFDIPENSICDKRPN